MSKREKIVTLAKLLEEVKIDKETIKGHIESGRILGKISKNHERHFFVPEGLYIELKQQTDNYGGIQNLVSSGEASKILGKPRIFFDDIVTEGEILPYPNVSNCEFLIYDSVDRVVRFHEKAILQYTIPAEYTKNKRAFTIKSINIRQEAIQELGHLYEINRRRLPSPKQFKSKVNTGRIVQRGKCPIVFYFRHKELNQSLHKNIQGFITGDGFMAYIETTQYNPVAPQDTRRDSDIFRQIIGWDSSECLNNGMDSKRRIARLSNREASYNMVVSIVRDWEQFSKKFPVRKIYIVDEYKTKPCKIIDRLALEIIAQDNGIFTLRSKPIWFDSLIRMYELNKANKYR